jgi:hypothetical protein
VCPDADFPLARTYAFSRTLPERFALEVHAFVLMDTHYRLLVRTREANLSQAMR